MGFKDAWNRQMERSKSNTFYGVHRVTGGEYAYLPEGSFKYVRKPVAGAVAEYEPGSAVDGRTTLTRVGVGAIVAGPVGAIVGGMFKKDRSRGYVSVTFPDGDVVVLDGPLTDEKKLREFARKVTDAGAQ